MEIKADISNISSSHRGDCLVPSSELHCRDIRDSRHNTINYKTRADTLLLITRLRQYIYVKHKQIKSR